MTASSAATPHDSATPSWPSVTVVIATVDRPVLLRRAVSAALQQTYDGAVDVVVVHDRTEPRPVAVDADRDGRSLRVVANDRTPGLAGARNTGILAATTDLVAFCDDDDSWAPTKLREQVDLWRACPDAVAIATGMVISTEQGLVEHMPPARVDFAQLLRSRVLGLHPSALLLRREDLLGAVGLVDEQLPQCYGEDYDLLLRLASRGEIVSVPKPLLMVDWARTSYFGDKWDAVSDGLTYVLKKFPEFRSDRRGWARMAGQIAFAHAAGGRRRDAARWALSALVRDPAQLRAYAAVLVGVGLVRAGWLLKQVQRHGRGL
ncbi:glycosyltransferase family 2 protein [Nocardioides sp. Iso805N]|uniref:glycosyltransferase family 2 protein n=1 Tax=Nocardioides sp. Iso805N TaxID=1283287 RepID=UPI000361FEB0|nr:glycosyltransferase family 2 protein [Nocardioides sp. Iso805N]